MTLARAPAASTSALPGVPRGTAVGSALRPGAPTSRTTAAASRPANPAASPRSLHAPAARHAPQTGAPAAPAAPAQGVKARLERVRVWGPLALALAFALGTGIFAGAAGAQWRASRLAGATSDASLNSQQRATLQWLKKLHPELPAPSAAAQENEADYHAWLDKALAKLRPADSATSGQNPVFTAADAFELARLAVEVSRADMFLARDNQAGGGSSYAPGIREEAATAMLRQLWKENHAWDL